MKSLALMLARTAVRSGALVVTSLSTARAAGAPSVTAMATQSAASNLMSMADFLMISTCWWGLGAGFASPAPRAWRTPQALAGVSAYPVPSLASMPAPGQGKW